MLLKSPKEFEHVAREWAVKFASAPPTDESGTSEELALEVEEAITSGAVTRNPSKPAQ